MIHSPTLTSAIRSLLPFNCGIAWVYYFTGQIQADADSATDCHPREGVFDGSPRACTTRGRDAFADLVHRIFEFRADGSGLPGRNGGDSRLHASRAPVLRRGRDRE